MKRSTVVPATLLGLALLVPLVPTPAAAAVTGQTGSYHPVAAARLLDTRVAKKPLGPGATTTLKVTGRGGLPSSGVAAVVVNVTATDVTAASSYLTVYPADKARPTVSSINFGKGRTTANTVTVPVSGAGEIKIYNWAGSTSVVVDLAGWYAGSGTGSTATGGTDYLSQQPIRAFDTRRDSAGPLPSGYALTAGISFPDQAMNRDVRALAVNLTAVGGGATGFLTAWDGVDPKPPVISSLNYQATTAVANTAVVRSRPDPTDDGAPVIDVYNGGRTPVHVVVDVVGVYVDTTSKDPSGLRFVPITPQRIVDSRSARKPLTPASTRTLSASAVANDATYSLIANVTAVLPTARTYLSVWPSGARPESSNLNAPAGRTVANGAVVDLTTTNTFQIYNSAGSTHFLVDVSGKLEPAPYSGGVASRSHRATAVSEHAPDDRR